MSNVTCRYVRIRYLMPLHWLDECHTFGVPYKIPAEFVGGNDVHAANAEETR